MVSVMISLPCHPLRRTSRSASVQRCSACSRRNLLASELRRSAIEILIVGVVDLLSELVEEVIEDFGFLEWRDGWGFWFAWSTRSTAVSFRECSVAASLEWNGRGFRGVWWHEFVNGINGGIGQVLHKRRAAGKARSSPAAVSGTVAR